MSEIIEATGVDRPVAVVGTLAATPLSVSIAAVGGERDAIGRVKTFGADAVSDDDSANNDGAANSIGFGLDGGDVCVPVQTFRGSLFAVIRVDVGRTSLNNSAADGSGLCLTHFSAFSCRFTNLLCNRFFSVASRFLARSAWNTAACALCASVAGRDSNGRIV